MSLIGLVFFLLVIYQLKHFLADYPLQGKFMLGKFSDDPDVWIPALGAHVAVHAAFTFLIANVVFLFYGVNDFGLAIEIALFDAAVHFVMDRLKAGKQFLGRFKALSANEYVALLTTEFVAPAEREKKFRSNRLFWISMGLDQGIHHLTHYACIYFILVSVGLV